VEKKAFKGKRYSGIYQDFLDLMEEQDKVSPGFFEELGNDLWMKGM
jgi:hypothetical protein